MKRILWIVILAAMATGVLLACGDDDDAANECNQLCDLYFECEEDIAGAAGVSVEVLRTIGYSNKGECVSDCESEDPSDGDSADGDDASDDMGDSCKNCGSLSDCAEIAQCIVVNCQ